MKSNYYHLLEKHFEISTEKKYDNLAKPILKKFLEKLEIIEEDLKMSDSQSTKSDKPIKVKKIQVRSNTFKIQSSQELNFNSQLDPIEEKNNEDPHPKIFDQKIKIIPEEFDEFSETHESQKSEKKRFAIKVNDVLMNGGIPSKFVNNSNENSTQMQSRLPSAKTSEKFNGSPDNFEVP